MTQRIPLIVANWKLNGDIDLVNQFATRFSATTLQADIAVCPPYLYARDMLHALEQTKLMVGCQTISEYESGAYTGEVSAQLLQQAGLDLCLIGHSERRQFFAETDASCNVKVQHALTNKLMPILCIGENLAQREDNITNKVLREQLLGALTKLDGELENLVIAYEPVWAIGTGKAASADDAQATHAYIRDQLTELFGTETAQNIRILYGGSANKNNAAALMEKPDIDGLLVGGASLDPEHFMQICTLAEGNQ